MRPFFLCGFLSTPRKKAGLFAVAIMVLAGLTFLQFDGFPVGPYMLIWLLGVGVAKMRRPLISSVPLSAAFFCFCSLIVRLFVRLSYENTHPVGLFLIDLLLRCFFANLLVSMKLSKGVRSPPGRDYNFVLASFSFSLYCIHTPILNLCVAAIHHYMGTGWKMIPTHPWQWCIVFGSMAISVIGAFLFSRITEVHTGVLRAWLLKRFRLDNSIREPTVRFR